jgi:hypothetical protein
MKKILASLILLLVFYNTNAQNAFLQPVQYRGAFAASPASPWTAGWSNFDPQNTIYPAANVVIDATAGDTIKTNTTWTSNNVYLLKGVVYVKDNVTLTIQPGTIIRGSELVANSSLVVTRGSKIVAEGTASRPIVFTSNKQPGARGRGNWGGLIILGKATNNISAAAGGTTGTGTAGLMQIEGLATTAINRHGAGDVIAASVDDNDSSGVLKFVRVEFPGFVFSANNEINGITFGSVGRKTVVDYIQVSYSDDDAYEWFGGTMNISHAIALATRDDDFDTDYGYNGSQQFGLVVRDPDMADASRSNVFESDNEASGNTRNPAFSPKTNPQVSNFTVIGPWRTNRTNVNVNYFAATELKRNTEIDIANSVMIGFQVGIGYQDSMTLARFKDSTSRLRYNIVAGTNTNRPTAPAILWKAATSGTLRSSYDSTSTDSTKRHFYRSYTNAGAVDADSSFFNIMKNERFDSRYGILVNPVNADFTNSDYRPFVGSPALSNFDYSTGASDFTISSADRLCTGNILGSVGDITVSNSTATGATYSVTAVTGADTYVWYVPDGFTITGGQGTRTITVSIATGKTGTVSVVPGARCTTNGAFTYGNIATLAVASCVGVTAPAAPTVTSNYANLTALIASSGTGTDSVATLNSTTPIGAVKWVWVLPTGVRESVGNLAGTVVTVAPKLEVEFLNTFVANSTLSVRVLNTCGDTSAARLFTLKSSAPKKGLIKSISALTSADTTAVVNVCSAFTDLAAIESSTLQYRVASDTLATSYGWTVSNPATMILVGDTATNTVSVKFTSTFTFGVLTNTKKSGGGNASASLTIKKVLPAKPGRLITKRNGTTPSPFLNVCDVIGTNEYVRYQLPATPLLSSSVAWSVSDTSKMEIVGGGTSADNFVDVKFRTGFVVGNITVYSINSCGRSASLITVVKSTIPVFPALTTITGATSGGALCGSTIVLRPSAPATDSTRNDYVWVLPTGLTPNNARISATLVGSVPGGTKYSTAADSIAIDWATAKAAKITVAGRSNCGEGKAISVTLIATPATPSVIDICKVAGNDTAFYLTIPAVTGVSGNSPYVWRVKDGFKIVSGQGTTSIRVQKTDSTVNRALSTVTVAAQNGCGISAVQTSAAFSTWSATTCTLPGQTAEISTLDSKDDANITSTGSIKLIPNPNKGQFILTVKSTNTIDKASIQIFDAYGRLVSTRFVNNSNGIISTSINDGSLISGTYNVICTIGSEIKTAQMVVQK